MVLQTAQILLGTTCGLVQVWGQFMLGVYARGSFIVGMILNCVAMLLFIGCSLVLVDAPLKPGKEARKNAYLMLLASFVGVVLSFVAVCPALVFFTPFFISQAQHSGVR